jgi:hypothetical protein
MEQLSVLCLRKSLEIAFLRLVISFLMFIRLFVYLVIWLSNK